jgi:hypothetical protein
MKNVLFTMQNLHLFEFLAEAFRCHVHHFQCLVLGLPSMKNGAHGTEEKFLLKTQRSEDFT